MNAISKTKPAKQSEYLKRACFVNMLDKVNKATSLSDTPVTKRLAEYRELVDQLHINSGDLFKKYPWLIVWMKAQDKFLEALFTEYLVSLKVIQEAKNVDFNKKIRSATALYKSKAKPDILKEVETP